VPGRWPPPPVAAQDVDADHFTANAITTGMTPMLLIGGSGNLNFSAGFTTATTCAGTSHDSGTGLVAVETDAAPTCQLHGSASYVSTVCGTGSLHGSATLTEYVGQDVSDTYTFTFDVVVVNFIGILAGTGAEANSTESDLINGTVTLVNTGPGTPPVCATSLDVILDLTTKL
jgi:hypothetical protein